MIEPVNGYQENTIPTNRGPAGTPSLDPPPQSRQEAFNQYPITDTMDITG